MMFKQSWVSASYLPYIFLPYLHAHSHLGTSMSSREPSKALAHNPFILLSKIWSKRSASVWLHSFPVFIRNHLIDENFSIPVFKRRFSLYLVFFIEIFGDLECTFLECSGANISTTICTYEKLLFVLASLCSPNSVDSG